MGLLASLLYHHFISSPFAAGARIWIGARDLWEPPRRSDRKCPQDTEPGNRASWWEVSGPIAASPGGCTARKWHSLRMLSKEAETTAKSTWSRSRRSLERHWGGSIDDSLLRMMELTPKSSRDLPTSPCGSPPLNTSWAPTPRSCLKYQLIRVSKKSQIVTAEKKRQRPAHERL